MFLDFSVTSSIGDPVSQTVISIMNNGDILSKGNTDSDGRYITTLEFEDLTDIDIYANKSGFVQGHANVVVGDNSSILTLSNINISTLSGNQLPAL